jgi:hypothetical protein
LSAGEQAERTILKLPTPFLEAKAISSGISESRIMAAYNYIRGTHECVSSLRSLLNIGINAARARSPSANSHMGSLAMSKLDLTEQHARERAGFAEPVPISISRDDTRDHANHRMLYVLGFGIAGAIVTNALVFIYFAVVYASG